MGNAVAASLVTDLAPGRRTPSAAPVRFAQAAGPNPFRTPRHAADPGRGFLLLQPGHAAKRAARNSRGRHAEHGRLRQAKASWPPRFGVVQEREKDAGAARPGHAQGPGHGGRHGPKRRRGQRLAPVGTRELGRGRRRGTKQREVDAFCTRLVGLRGHDFLENLIQHVVVAQCLRDGRTEGRGHGRRGVQGVLVRRVRLGLGVKEQERIVGLFRARAPVGRGRQSVRHGKRATGVCEVQVGNWKMTYWTSRGVDSIEGRLPMSSRKVGRRGYFIFL